MTFGLYGKIADWEMKTNKRVRRRLARTGLCSWTPLSVSLAICCAHGLTTTPPGASITRSARLYQAAEIDKWRPVIRPASIRGE
jgi:hypothetical protein